MEVTDPAVVTVLDLRRRLPSHFSESRAIRRASRVRSGTLTVRHAQEAIEKRAARRRVPRAPVTRGARASQARAVPVQRPCWVRQRTRTSAVPSRPTTARPKRSTAIARLLGVAGELLGPAATGAAGCVSNGGANGGSGTGSRDGSSRVASVRWLKFEPAMTYARTGHRDALGTPRRRVTG
jgi:hypothetical protein